MAFKLSHGDTGHLTGLQSIIYYSQIDYFGHLRFKNVPLKLPQLLLLLSTESNKKLMWLVKVSHISDLILAACDSPHGNQCDSENSRAPRPSEASTSNVARNHSTAAKPITGFGAPAAAPCTQTLALKWILTGRRPIFLSLFFEGRKKKKPKAAATSREGRKEGGGGQVRGCE